MTSGFHSALSLLHVHRSLQVYLVDKCSSQLIKQENNILTRKYDYN